MSTLPIHSIYPALEGEGIHLGLPQVFIRLQGCAIGCLNCDSKETWEFADRFHQSITSIVSKIHSDDLSHIKRISITGGDPTHPSFEASLILLITQLKEENYSINIEASGTRVVKEIFDLVDFISFDIKTPSTGVKINSSLIEKLKSNYLGKFQLKAVIQNRDDFNFLLKLYDQYGSTSVPWVLTPCYNTDEQFPLDRFRNLIEWNLSEGGFFRVIGQQHKWVYGPSFKDV